MIIVGVRVPAVVVVELVLLFDQVKEAVIVIEWVCGCWGINLSFL